MTANFLCNADFCLTINLSLQLIFINYCFFSVISSVAKLSRIQHANRSPFFPICNIRYYRDSKKGINVQHTDRSLELEA